MRHCSENGQRAWHWLLLALALLLLAVGTPQAVSADVPFPQAKILSHDTPEILFAGEASVGRVVVQNTGETTWPAAGPVRLSYHWLDKQGAVVTFEGLRTMLPGDVAPGETITLLAQVRVPSKSDGYRLQWQMLVEGRAWLEQPAGAATAEANITVHSRRLWESAAAEPGSLPPGDLARWLVFCFTMAGHLALHLWLGLRLPGSRYARLFEALLLCLGSLYASLHLVVFVAGLELWRGLATLLAVDGLFVWFSLRVRPASTLGHTDRRRNPSIHDLAGWLLALVAVAVCLRWLFVATRITDVPGIDARQYHVPHALHYANGLSPWGLLPTPDLYPMSTSLLGAWFMQPFRNPSMIELTNLPLLALALIAMGEIARLTTGRSGWRWGVALGLTLLATPMGQVIAPISADMSYSAFFLALFALALRAWSTARISARDSLLLAIGTGLLLGCKVSGPVAVVSVLGLLIAALVIRRLARGARIALPRRWPLLLPGLLLVVVACGGIWQVRNWIVYGSPLAPSGITLGGWTVFPGWTYGQTKLALSVLADIQDRPDYRVGVQALRYVRKWLGAGYVWLALGLLGYAAQAAWLARRHDQPQRALVRRRFVLLMATLVLTGLHLALFVGLPWTSLERGEGQSMRYVMPLFMLFGASMLMGLIPRQPLSKSRLTLAQLGSAILVLAMLIAGILTASQPGFTELLVGLSLDALLMALLPVAAMAWIVYRPNRWSTAALATVMVATMALSAQVNLSNHVTAQLAVTARRHQALLAVVAAGQDALNDQTDYQGDDIGSDIWLAAHVIHVDTGSDEAFRRVFRLTRCVFPLRLYDMAYHSEVYDLNPYRHVAISADQRSRLGDYYTADK